MSYSCYAVASEKFERLNLLHALYDCFLLFNKKPFARLTAFMYVKKERSLRGFSDFAQQIAAFSRRRLQSYLFLKWVEIFSSSIEQLRHWYAFARFNRRSQVHFFSQVRLVRKSSSLEVEQSSDMSRWNITCGSSKKAPRLRETGPNCWTNPSAKTLGSLSFVRHP